METRHKLRHYFSSSRQQVCGQTISMSQSTCFLAVEISSLFDESLSLGSLHMSLRLRIPHRAGSGLRLLIFPFFHIVLVSFYCTSINDRFSAYLTSSQIGQKATNQQTKTNWTIHLAPVTGCGRGERYVTEDQCYVYLF